MLSLAPVSALLSQSGSSAQTVQTNTPLLSSPVRHLTQKQQGQVYDEAVHILGGNGNVISRWVGAIRYHVIGSKRFQQQAELTLREVASLTALSLIPGNAEPVTADAYLELLKQTPPIRISSCSSSQAVADQTTTGHEKSPDAETRRTESKQSSPEPACSNFVVVQSSNAMMKKMADAIPLRKVYTRSLSGPHAISCFFAPFVGSRQVIRQAIVYVSDELDDAMLQTCLHEEIYQSLGLFNDVTDSVYFSFNNKVEPKSITAYDRLLLKTVYAPEFAPGTPVFRVMERYMDDLGYDPFGRKQVESSAD